MACGEVYCVVEDGGTCDVRRRISSCLTL